LLLVTGKDSGNLSLIWQRLPDYSDFQRLQRSLPFICWLLFFYFGFLTQPMAKTLNGLTRIGLSCQSPPMPTTKTGCPANETATKAGYWISARPGCTELIGWAAIWTVSLPAEKPTGTVMRAI